MSDEIKKRLQESTDQCIQSYEAWRKDEKNESARETLQDAVHEIRKVASRLEIELAVSEREQTTQKPLPIPQNRNAQEKSQEAKSNKPKSEKKPKNQDIKAGLKKKSPPKNDEPKKAEGE